MIRQTRSLVIALSAAWVTTWGATAAAKPEYPGKLQEKLDMPCAPTCMLCHTSPEGGGDKINSFAPFGSAVANGQPPESFLMGDADGDNVSDLDELKKGTNPVIEGDATVCVPEYGCGARLARTPDDGRVHSDGWLLGALGVGLLLRLKMRSARTRR